MADKNNNTDTNNNNDEENNEEKPDADKEKPRERTAAEMRKINKPLMEKKRRERINNCLNQLKMFLMDATKKDSSYYSKLEKADILEMTVKYLKNLQRQHLSAAMTTDPKVVHKFVAGYSQCASEVQRYLGKMESFNPELKSRLSNHLSNCVNKLDTPTGALQQVSFGNPMGQSQQPLGLSLASGSSILLGQSDGGDLNPLSQLGSTVISSTSPMSFDSPAIPSTSGLNLNQVVSSSQGMYLQPSTTTGPVGSITTLNSSGILGGQQIVQPQTILSSASTLAEASTSQSQQSQGVPVVPVQLIPAKLPSGDLVFLMTNQNVQQSTVTNVMNPVSIQIPGNTLQHPTSTAIITAKSISSTIPSALGAPTLLPLSSNIPSAALGAAPNNSFCTSNSGSAISTTSVAVVPPQVQEPKVETSSISLPSPNISHKPKPILPLFSYDSDKPLDLGPSTSSFRFKIEKTESSPFNFGTRPKSVASSTVTSSSPSLIDKQTNSTNEPRLSEMNFDNKKQQTVYKQDAVPSGSSYVPGNPVLPFRLGGSHAFQFPPVGLHPAFQMAPLIAPHQPNPVPLPLQAPVNPQVEAAGAHAGGQPNILNIPHDNMWRPW